MSRPSHGLQKQRKAASPVQSSIWQHLYANGDGIVRDPVKAVEWFTKAAEQGYSDSFFNLGAMYQNGDGVAKDSDKAAEWFERGAMRDPRASFNLGLMYESGEGVEKDPVKAAQWYQKAAEEGNVSAQHNLAVLYVTGEGVDKG